MWNICKFINSENNTDQTCCRGIKKYGDYCYKHRRNHLIDEDNYIIHENFTNVEKDYLLKDLKYNYNHILKCKNNKKEKRNKWFYFKEISDHINHLNNYDKTKIKLIQKIYKKHLHNKYTRCNNSEDFYTFDPIKSIPFKYFYIYQDSKNFYWGFDIRSLAKLIDMNNTNPYTTEIFPEIIVNDIKNRINKLKSLGDFIDIDEKFKKDRKQQIKQNAVDLFADIELNGYSCQVEWYTSLSIRRLKELYKQLEDLWNYRLKYHEDTKKRLVPPHGKLFTTPISEIIDYENINDLQELILSDILKFKNISDDSDKKLGYMYFLICLSYVSPICYQVHQDWISAINQQ